MFGYAFMQRALIAGILVSIITSLMGNFLVLRRYSQIGDSLSHTAIVGVAAAIILNFSPTTGAIFATVLFSLFLEFFKIKFKRFEEVSLSLMSITALGIAAVLFGVLKSSANVMRYLFGRIVAISYSYVYLITATFVITISYVIIFRNWRLFSTFDEVGASVSGINTKLIDISLNILSALIISVSLKIVGGLLISALIVFPTAIAMRVSQNFKNLQMLSFIVSMICVLSGLTFSYYVDVPPGGATVLIFVTLFLLIELYSSFKKTISKRQNSL